MRDMSDIVLGKMAIERGLLKPEDLRNILADMAQRMRPDGTVCSIGDIMIEKGYITPEDLRKLHDEARPLPEDRPENVLTAGEPSEGTRLGTYIIEGLLGRGGMGAVYKALDTRLGRTVALKTLIFRDADDVELQRFHREARLAARLSHPNIVPIYDIQESGGTHFIAMEYIDATTFDRAALDRRERLRVLQTAAEALDYAHRQGVIHRDVKPKNILIDRQGKPFIADFGLAKESRPGSTMTMSQIVMGTPGYMSPEQAEGKRREVDGRSDVYAIGVMIYETLAGKLPFDGETAMDIMMKVVNDEPITPRKINPLVDAEIEAVCLKAMEKEPHRRYADAGELAKDLGRYLNGEPVLARRPTVMRKVTRKLKKHKGVAITVTLAVMALLAALGWSVMGKWRRDAAQPHFDKGAQLLEKAENLLYVRGANMREHLELSALAEEELSKAIERSPDFAEAHLQRGKARALRKNYPSAISDFTRALELLPTSATAFLERGNARMHLIEQDVLKSPGKKPPETETGSRNAAIGAMLDDFRKVASLTTEGAVPHYANGCIAMFEGNYEKAAAHFADAVAADKFKPEYHLWRGNALLRLRRFEEALASCDTAIAQRPNDYHAHVNRGYCRLSLGRISEAGDDFTEALRIDPRGLAALHNRAKTRVLEKQFDKALEDADAIVKERPELAASYSLRAGIRLQRNDIEGALQDYASAIERDPRQAPEIEKLIRAAREKRKQESY